VRRDVRRFARTLMGCENGRDGPRQGLSRSRATTPVLKNPEHVWQGPFVTLRSLCEELGVGWREFVDGAVSPGC
jgi:hypothetical protein